jgi:hypothetical protein
MTINFARPRRKEWQVQTLGSRHVARNLQSSDLIIQLNLRVARAIAAGQPRLSDRRGVLLMKLAKICISGGGSTTPALPRRVRLIGG